MNYKRFMLVAAIILFAAIISVLFICMRGNILPVFLNSESTEIPSYTQTIPNNAADKIDTYRIEKTINFADGSFFNISRLIFGENDILKGKYTYELELYGGDISVKWQDYDENPSKWQQATELQNIPAATLFIETDRTSMVLSIPAIYLNNFEHKTLESIPEKEMPVRIKETDTGYIFSLDFEASDNTIGEFWYYKTPNELINWNEENSDLWLKQDLHKNRRFSFDGYYFRTNDKYIPYSENGFYRNAANFTGAQILAMDGINSSSNIGYAMTKICMDNQNVYGFWETGPMSVWLYNDYGIGFDFYDTRFSTDFARSLLIGYEKYNYKDFLDSAGVYAHWLLRFIDDEGYQIGSADNVLVPDYWAEAQEKKTHVSLNHLLSEMNFLIEIYLITDYEPYLDYALKLLSGISVTADEWILPDNNLKYAIMYDETSNVMKDYPYLTYNDLYDSNALLLEIGIKNPSIERLMKSKKLWMDHNNITEYKK